ncbi:MAG: TraR/DksA C4-type zinc finger protein [Deltaproteobacteria bacterium]
MAQIRCDGCKTMIDEQRAVHMGDKTLCPACAQKMTRDQAQMKR